MSRLAALFLVVVGGVALADTSEPPASPPKTEQAPQAAPAKSSNFPLKVVKILSDSEQALLFDNGKHRHVLVEVGDSVGDYIVAVISTDAVLLKGKDVPVEVELASPDKKPTPAKKADDKPVAKPDVKQETKAAPDKDAAPQNPYEPGEEKAKEVPKPEKSSEAEGAPSDPYAEVEATEDQTVVATHWGAPEEEEAKPEPPKPAETKLAKKDVNAALLDFTQLVGSIDGTWIPQGLKLDKVKAGSIFAKAGLLAGDVVVSVDGQPMQTIDDAADLYARAGNMKQSNVQILRAGKEQTLRVAIQ